MNRYIFTIRQGGFGDKVGLASFAEILIPENINNKLAKEVDDLIGEDIFLRNERYRDNLSVSGTRQAMRANQDTYQHLLIVTTEFELSRKDFSDYITSLDKQGTLLDFMKEHHA